MGQFYGLERSVGHALDLLVSVGFVFGSQVEEAVEAGWGFASVVLLAAMVFLTAFAWWRINKIGTHSPNIQVDLSRSHQ